MPVDQPGVRDHPGLEHSLELPVSIFGGEQLVVLVAARDIHLDLPVRARLRLLVNVPVLPVNVALNTRWGRDEQKQEEGKVDPYNSMNFFKALITPHWKVL